MATLTAGQQKFILNWGELGTRWGLNRTVAQIHALLYLSQEPLRADEIVSLLSVERSNVSTSLRELQGWGVARVVRGQVTLVYEFIGSPRRRRLRSRVPLATTHGRRLWFCPAAIRALARSISQSLRVARRWPFG